MQPLAHWNFKTLTASSNILATLKYYISALRLLVLLVG